MPHSFHRDDATFAQVDYSDLAGTAPSQITIADKRILSNISGSSAAASGNTLSDILDNIIGSTRGALLMRGSSGWSKIDPGTSGNFLKSNGTGADPSYAAITPPPTWEVAQTLTPTSGSSLTIQNLGNYQEVIVVILGMTITASGSNFCRVNWSFSADNGSNFLSNITWMSADGAFLSSQSVIPTGSNTQTTINAMMRAVSFNQSTITPFFTSGSTDVGTVTASGAVNSATALNAIKLTPGATSPTITGGAVTVLGLKST